MLVIQIEPIDCIRTKHLCYYTEEHELELWLFEVYEATYPHPQAPEDAIISQVETRLLKKVRRTERHKIAEMELLENAQHATRKSITR